MIRHATPLAAGVILLTPLLALGLISLAWTPNDPGQIDILHRLAPLSARHPFGTDPFGRDLLSRVMEGLRHTLATMAGAVALGLLLGVPAGLAAAASGPRGATPLMRACDLLFAFPPVLTAAMVAAASGPGEAGAILAIGAFNIPVFARVARAAALVVLTQDYIAASRLAGRGWASVLALHVLPNIAPPLLVQASVQAGIAVLAEAGLTYLGLGLPPPAPSLGSMLKEYQATLYEAPHLVLIPGAVVALLVLGCNLLGDGLRDRLSA